jgi:hypothetical protein
MGYFVLAAWVVQGGVGIALIVRWARAGRAGAFRIVAHVACALAALALWIAFLAAGLVPLAWSAFAVVTVGNTIGDTLLVNRSRRLHGDPGHGWPDYRRAIADTFRWRLPRPVTFHALFSAVVYFTCLGVCIAATVTDL